MFFFLGGGGAINLLLPSFKHAKCVSFHKKSPIVADTLITILSNEFTFTEIL